VSVHILDASAMIAYLGAEPGGLVVRTLLNDPTAVCYAHIVNLCEVYYNTIRSTDVSRARQTILNLYSDGVIARRDMGTAFWQRVGELKARRGISLPDCFCISLAQQLSGEVVTSDHGEFDPLVPPGIVPINFIR
jgi:PIN domain nuclease of toxin-antitoxin system